MANKLRIVLLVGSGRTIVAPLLDEGFNIVGIADVEDETTCLSFPRKIMDTLYWQWLKRRELPYLSVLAKSRHIPYFDINRNKIKNLPAWLHKLKPDVMICHSAVLLPADVFTIPEYGTINIHPSLLPKYRGANPHFWLYYNMDMTAGVTIHFIDEHIDTGDIIAQSSFTVTLGQKIDDVRQTLIHEHALPLLIKTLRTLEREGRLESKKQPDNSRFPYARRLTNEEYMQTVDFENRPLDHVWHVLHAIDQWRDCILPKDRLARCYQWELGDRERQDMSPPYGKLSRDKQGFFITHKEGKIHLRRKFSVRRTIKLMLGMSWS